MSDENVTELNDDSLDRIVELEAELAKTREALAAAQMTKSDPEDDADDDEAAAGEEDLMKSLPEPVRQMLAKAQDDANAAREELRKEREQQRDREYIAKAVGWNNLDVDATALGLALRKVADIDADTAATIEATLDAVNAQQEAAAIFSELGKSASAPTGNTFNKVTAMAKAAVERGEFGTVEQAVSGLIAQNPDLYNDYLSER